MTYYLKMENDEGSWWWQAASRWCDRYEDATAFDDHYAAKRTAVEAQARAGHKVRAVSFKGAE